MSTPHVLNPLAALEGLDIDFMSCYTSVSVSECGNLIHGDTMQVETV